MAQFTLTINTDDAFELSTIAKAVAGAAGNSLSSRTNEGDRDLKDIPDVVAVYRPAPVADAAPAPVADAAPAPVADAAPAPVADALPERDAHGLKRDMRIHSDAAEPKNSKGLWKRRRNLEEDYYDEHHEALVREAMAAGVYTGPIIPALTLENRVAEMAPPPPPAPAGMSAQDTPTGPKVIQTLVTAAGARSAQVMLKALGAKSVTEVQPQDLRNWMEIAEAVKTMAIAPADKATAGVQAMVTIAGDYGYDCSSAL